MRKLKYTAPQCQSFSFETNKFIALSVGKDSGTTVTDPGQVRSNRYETPKFTWRGSCEDEQR